MTHDVFISHSAEDRPLAHAICAKLEENGVACWMAPRNVRPGENYSKAIINAIIASRVMVIVFSSAANNSKHVAVEVERAFSNMVLLVPFRIENIEPCVDLQYFFSTAQWLDAFPQVTKGHIDQLVLAIKESLDDTAAAEHEAAIREDGQGPEYDEEQDWLDQSASPPGEHEFGGGPVRPTPRPARRPAPPRPQRDRDLPRGPVHERGWVGVGEENRKSRLTTFFFGTIIVLLLALVGLLALALFGNYDLKALLDRGRGGGPPPTVADAPPPTTTTLPPPTTTLPPPSTTVEPAKPELQPGQIWMDELTRIEFVWVPAGCYEMGCGGGTMDCGKDEEPAHRVCLDGFWLGKYEITQGQWHQVMGDNPALFQKGTNYPVERVSWHDAREFIRKLGALHQGKFKFRLPTEAEWEYGARGLGADVKYAGGADLHSAAWYEGNSEGGTRPVGTKSPNSLGLYDLSGNVFEWCRDVYVPDGYLRHGKDDPVVEDGGRERVVRGGSWADKPVRLRCTARFGFSPSLRIVRLGLRLVREAE